MKKKFYTDYIFTAVLVCVLLLFLGISHYSEAQTTPLVDSVITETTTADDNNAEAGREEEQGEDGNNESSKDGKIKEADSEKDGGGINISESIPVDRFIESWQGTYSKSIGSLGLENSTNARVLASVIIFVVAFVVLFASKKLTHFLLVKMRQQTLILPMSPRKLSFYFKSIYALFIASIIIGVLSALAVTWEVSVEKFVPDEFLISVLANALTVYAIVLGGTIVVDLACGLVERVILRWGRSSQSRVDTLLPIARNTIFIVFFVIFSLMLLAELGMNVMPLLAGAGVVGFAIGFGAQTIVKDLLTGFIIILEDLIQVGDVATLAGCSGLVEKITIRKVQLRALDGTVYTVPFGEITVVENLTKDFSYAMFDVGVAYRENVENVKRLLLQLDEEIRADEEFSGDIIEPLEILGLDKFADSAVIIKARMKTKPIKQWRIMREFNHRMKKLFDLENIEIPFPHQTIYFGEDRQGKAPPLRHLPVADPDKATSLEVEAEQEKRLPPSIKE